MVFEERSHEEGVRAVTVLRIEGLVRTLFVRAVCVQGAVVPDFNSSVFVTEKLRRDVWDRVSEVYHSIVFIRELLHNVV